MVSILRRLGLGAAADRLSYLLRVVEDEPDEAPVQIDSLRHLALFLITERRLRLPRIGVSPDGVLQVEWRVEDSGILAMWFLVDGRVQFAAAVGEGRSDAADKRVSGILPKDEAMQAVRPFTSGLALE